VLDGEAANTNFILFALTRPGIETNTLTITLPAQF